MTIEHFMSQRNYWDLSAFSSLRCALEQAGQNLPEERAEDMLNVNMWPYLHFQSRGVEEFLYAFESNSPPCSIA